MQRPARRSLRLVASVATALALALLATASAVAAPPVKNDLSFSDTVTCHGGITFTVNLQGRETVTELPGDRLRIHQVWHGRAVSSNGTTLRVHHAFSEVVDLAAGTVTITGLLFGTSVEGSSIKHLDRGRVVLDLGTGEPIFLAGKSTPPDPEGKTCRLIAEAAS